MTKSTSASELALAKVFGGDFQFRIPSYQRPYSWDDEHVNQLFDDLLESFVDLDQTDYFLGSIVLIKNEEKEYFDVVDGQQRLTTLTILLAVLANRVWELVPDATEAFEGIRKFLLEKASEYPKRAEKLRLMIRKQDKDFFCKHIQQTAFAALSDVDFPRAKLDSAVLDEIFSKLNLTFSKLNEPQSKMILNCLWLVARVAKEFGKDAERLHKFVDFLKDNCHIVVVTSSNSASAMRIFSVLNDRGLNLQPTDIIKAELMHELTDEDLQESFSEQWERIEEDLGREEFRGLLTYIRMIHAKSKVRRNLVEEFRLSVINHYKNPLKEENLPYGNGQQYPMAILKSVVKPYSETLSSILRPHISTEIAKIAKHEEINGLLLRLNTIGNSDWIPAALEFMEKNKGNHPLVAEFIFKLERLAAYMLMLGEYSPKRISRYGRILSEMAEKPQTASLHSLELSESEKAAMKEVLNGNVYSLPRARHSYALLRLNDFFSSRKIADLGTHLTIEHVLPQKIKAGSEWLTLWPDEAIREKWLHCIGNLVLLDRSRNSSAGNKDFAEKRDIYFSTEHGAVPYMLTSTVLQASTWTVHEVEARQKMLMNLYVENWKLD